MYQRIALLALMLCLTACSSPPPAIDNTALAPTGLPSTAVLQTEAPESTPSATPTVLAITPTPGGPLNRIALWGDGIPLGATYSPDGQSIAVLRPDALELRTAQLSDMRWSIKLSQVPTSLAFTPDGTTIAVSAGASIALYASTNGAQLGAIPGLGASIADIAISPDGRLLAAAQDDQIISLWDISERSNLSELHLPQPTDGFIVPGTFTSVAFSPNGQAIAAGDDGGNVGVWAIADGVTL
ncbi:MAG: hypothetical protein HGA19_16315, partial [Oscillochloris sp.]|nr:hypothetical protein [Oscillochloris sp.]